MAGQDHKIKVIAYLDENGFNLLDSTTIMLEKCQYQGCGKILNEKYSNGLSRNKIFYYAISEDMTQAIAFKNESKNICGEITHADKTWLKIIYFPRYKN